MGQDKYMSQPITNKSELIKLCPRRDLNSYDPFGPADFKSAGSTHSPTRTVM